MNPKDIPTILITGMPKTGKTSLRLAFERAALKKGPVLFQRWQTTVTTTAYDFNRIQPTTAVDFCEYFLQLRERTATKFRFYEFPNPILANPFNGYLTEFLEQYRICQSLIITLPHPSTVLDHDSIQDYYVKLLDYLNSLNIESSRQVTFDLLILKGEQTGGTQEDNPMDVIVPKYPLLADRLNIALETIRLKQVFTVGWDTRQNVNYASGKISESLYWEPKLVYEYFSELLNLSDGN